VIFFDFLTVHGAPGFPFCRRGSLVVTPSRAGNRPAAWVMEFCVGELADGTTSRSWRRLCGHVGSVGGSF
jgi:hypothetical protein